MSAVHPTPIKIKCCCLVIVALTLWLGGFGCALCCAGQITETCCSGQINKCQITRSNTERGESSCCSKPQRCAGSTDVITRPACVKACNLFHERTPSLVATSLTTDDSVAEINGSQWPSLNALRAAQFVTPSMPRNRSGTYLRSCTLLI